MKNKKSEFFNGLNKFINYIYDTFKIIFLLKIRAYMGY